MLARLNSYFDARKDYGIIFLRMVIGWRLIDGTQDNILSWGQMLEFRDFLNLHGTPFPLFSAVMSVYAQFACGILYMVGWQIRVAAMVMIVNFIAALLIAHIGLSFQQSFDAWVVLAASVYFLFSGAGRISVDHWRNDRN
jgi:putative oxidoreductase